MYAYERRAPFVLQPLSALYCGRMTLEPLFQKEGPFRWSIWGPRILASPRGESGPVRIFALKETFVSTKSIQEEERTEGKERFSVWKGKRRTGRLSSLSFLTDKCCRIERIRGKLVESRPNWIRWGILVEYHFVPFSEVFIG